ncbi:MAG: SRPBCC domain-containing protein [Ferruginibacter sp.]
MENNKTQYTQDLQNNMLLVIREFDAPLENVWRAWTESDLLEQWWAPKPWKAETKSMNFTEGGSWLYSMVGPEGERHWCRVDFKAIQKQQSFTVTNYFCDEHGVKNTDMPVMEWKNIFTSAGDKTRVNVEVKFGSKEDLDKIVAMGFKEGFSMALDNLDGVFAK